MKKNASQVRPPNQPSLMSFFKKKSSPSASVPEDPSPQAPKKQRLEAESSTGPSVPFSTVPVKRPAAEVVWTERKEPPKVQREVQRESTCRDVCPYFCRPSGCKRGSSCPLLHYNDFGYGVLRVPWSTKNLYLSQSGKACRHWDLISTVMSDYTGTPIRSGMDLEEFIITLYPPILGGKAVFPRNFDTLVSVVDKDMSARERKVLFDVTIPWMRQQVLQAPSLFPRGVPLLLQGTAPSSVVLSQMQVCVLLICCFFCLFPGRHPASAGQFLGDNELMHHAKKLGYVNFGALFGTEGPQARGKIRCFLQYFATAAQTFSSAEYKSTNIELVRCACGGKAQDVSARLVSSSAPLLPVKVSTTGLIEDCEGVMQCDFANKVLGGGVLARGCVQEEIRFAVCPELLMSRLLAEMLLPNEALIMNGSTQYSNYSGYAKTFAFAGPAAIPALSAQEASRNIRNVCVVAMDAIDFAHHSNLSLHHQFFPFWVEREVIKAFAAFSGAPSLLPSSATGPIATGNWGCGAFGGDLQLKFLIQWCAASAARRPLNYFTFENSELAAEIESLVDKILSYGKSQKRPTTAGELYSALIMFQTARMTAAATAAAATASLSCPALAEAEDELDPWLALVEDTEDEIADDVHHVMGRSPSFAAAKALSVFDIVAKSMLEDSA